MIRASQLWVVYVYSAVLLRRTALVMLMKKPQVWFLSQAIFVLSPVLDFYKLDDTAGHTTAMVEADSIRDFVSLDVACAKGCASSNQGYASSRIGACGDVEMAGTSS